MEFSFTYLAGRALLYLLILVPLFLSQRYWFRQAWRLTERVRWRAARWTLQAGWVVALAAVVVPFVAWITGPSRRSIPESSSAIGHVLLWLFASIPAYLAVQVVRGAEKLWNAATRMRARRTVPHGDAPANPSRRYFFQTATVLAGATPIIGIVYGYSAGRIRYCIERVEVPLSNLPAALDGLRIVQLSDFHMGGYMTREGVRRAVDMAGELGAELAAVTGDYITWSREALEGCVEEISRLRAPLGVWGCLGNHEIYTRTEDEATRLLAQAGVRVLRSENASVRIRDETLNIIGVDFQRSRSPSGRKTLMLPGVERLVRRDAFNILLSHSPNAFDRAAELGIELTLAGHTHGGQINVEILDSQLSPARFVTDYVAGLFSKYSPLGPRASHLYVNRGLGTIGAPVRLGASPEITLITLRRT